MYAVQRLVFDGGKLASKDVRFYPNEMIGVAFKQLRKLYFGWKIVSDCLTKDCKEFWAVNEDGQEVKFEFEPVDRQVIYRRPR